MKIAYLIVGYNNWLHFNKLLSLLDYEGAALFIHIDKKVKMPPIKVDKARLIFVERLNVWWGGWSLQEAFNRLIKSAIIHRFDYYVLLSGADYPIRPLSYLYKKLSEGGEYISINKGFSPDKPEWRIKYYHFDGSDRKNKTSIKTIVYFWLEVLQRKLRLISKTKYPFDQVYFGSSWWALSHECVEYVLQFINDNPGFVRFFKTSWCPDESFIHTIIGNSPFLSECKGSMTYADWTENRASPAIINMKHVEMFAEQLAKDTHFQQNGPCFARKFEDKSENIINAIHKHLL